MSPHRLLAAVAALAGVLAAFAGTPAPRKPVAAPAAARPDVARLAAAVAHEDDHITAIELAEWIRGRKPGLRIIDLRGKREFDTYHLPRAENVPIEPVVSTPFRAEETVVLISDGGAHAAQAWVLLQVLGHQKTYFLRGGLGEWLSDVMTPTLPANASPEATAAFRKASELSRYFGGTPRVAPPVPANTTTTWRPGC
jgi:rhodanese-related sulfurtransferase